MNPVCSASQNENPPGIAHPREAVNIAPPEVELALNFAFRIAMATLDAARHPTFLFWRPQNVCYFNDAALALFGADAGARGMGWPGPAICKAAWSRFEPGVYDVLEGRFASGSWAPSFVFSPQGRLGEPSYRVDFSPAFGEHGAILGALASLQDITEETIAGRRLEAHRTLLARTSPCRSVEAVLRECVGTLREIPRDVHFALMLAYTPTKGFCIEAFSGFAADADAVSIAASFKPGTALAARLECQMRRNESPFIPSLASFFSPPPSPSEPWPWPVSMREAYITARRIDTQHDSWSVVLYGLDPGQPFTAGSACFLERISDAMAQALERERARSDAEVAQRDLYDFFMQSTSPMAILHGPEHHFFLTNPQFALYVRRDVDGKSLREAFRPEEVNFYRDILDKVYDTGRPWIGRDLQLTLQDPDGMMRHMNIDQSYHPVRGNDGKVKCIVAFVQDVTAQSIARREIEESRLRLQSALEAAERASRAKTAFLANMSHEIRTPMTAILGFTEILHEGALGEPARRAALGRIHASGRALLRIIDDLLDISKIESGHFDSVTAPFSPREIAVDVLSCLRPCAERKCLSLTLYVDDAVPARAISDAVRIRQAMLNVMGNALKFTHEGGVQMRLGWDEGNVLVVEVEDSGIGVSAQEARGLFRPFSQADDSMTRTFGGTGLGLAIARGICEALGGTLTLERSEVNRGSLFVARFKVRLNQELDGTPHQSPPLEGPALSLMGVRALVVEDVPDNQILFARILENAGASVDVADDGVQAVDLVSQCAYDVILMDVQMPRMDGLEATRILRLRGYRGPVLALTAHAMPEEKDRCLAAGCDAHLAKPVSRDALVGAIDHWRRAASAQARPEDPCAAESLI